MGLMQTNTADIADKKRKVALPFLNIQLPRTTSASFAPVMCIRSAQES